MKNLYIKLPAACYALCALICPLVSPVVGHDFDALYIYFLFPFLSLCFCWYLACVCSPWWSWIFPVAGWLALAAALHCSPLALFDTPTFYGGVVGYLLGILLWALVALLKQMRRAI